MTESIRANGYQKCATHLPYFDVFELRTCRVLYIDIGKKIKHLSQSNLFLRYILFLDHYRGSVTGLNVS